MIKLHSLTCLARHQQLELVGRVAQINVLSARLAVNAIDDQVVVHPQLLLFAVFGEDLRRFVGNGRDKTEMALANVRAVC